jgi:hypothetical protein
MIPPVYEFVIVFAPEADTDMKALEADLVNLLFFINPLTRKGGTVGIDPIGDDLYCLKAVRLEKFDDGDLFKAIRLVSAKAEVVHFSWDNNDDSVPGHFHIVSILTNILFGGRNSVKEALRAKITEAAVRVGLISLECDSGYADGVMTVVLRSQKPITQKQLDTVLEAIEEVENRDGTPYPVIMGSEAPLQLPPFARFLDWLRWKLRGR